MFRVIFMLLLGFGVAFSMSIDKLNSATKEELMAIKGVGDKKASAIIKERKKGKFKSFDDLKKRVKGIGDGVANNIKKGIKAKDGSKSSKKSKKESKTKTTKSKDKKSSKSKKSVESKSKKKSKKDKEGVRG